MCRDSLFRIWLRRAWLTGSLITREDKFNPAGIISSAGLWGENRSKKPMETVWGEYTKKDGKRVQLYEPEPVYSNKVGRKENLGV